MQNPTKSGTSTYHPTIDWAKPNLSFSQSPTCHITSMNVGSQDINSKGFSEIKLPPLSGYRDLTKTSQEITKPKKSLDGLEFLHHYLEEFSYLHPRFPKNKPPPPPTLGNSPKRTSPSSKTFQPRKESHHTIYI